MPSTEPDLSRYRGWRRHVIGALGVILISVGMLLWTGTLRSEGAEGIGSFAFRVGLVLGALWLALPQLGAMFAKYPPWLIITVLAMIAVAVVQPKMLLYMIPLIGILIALKVFGWFTRPFSPAEGERTARPSRPPATRAAAPPSGPRDSRSNRENSAGTGE